MIYRFLLIILSGTILVSCRKDSQDAENIFFGKWVGNNNDTISFGRENGRNILTYGSWNSSILTPVKREYKYRLDHLNLYDAYSNRFSPLPSFRWVQPRTVFSVQGVEWYPFISSTTTYFTYTRIE